MPYIRNLLHPEYFQGEHRRDNYFEGWYYKFVSADERHTIALIPGVSINKADPHAFIQAFVSKHDEGGVTLRTSYHRFPLDAFTHDRDGFDFGVAKNTFAGDRVAVDLRAEGFTLRGALSLADLTPIRKTLFVPNIMGFFGYFKFMECYHGVISMTHRLSGSLTLDGETVAFGGGKGYLEKDWGKSFPRAYVWIQSNHFRDPAAAFMFSHADIPFLGMHFRGLIANLVAGGREYRFATYNATRVIMAENGEGWVRYRLKKGRLTLELEAHSDRQIGLASPRNGRMIEEIKEGLSGTVKLCLKRGDAVLFEDEGGHAGIEIMHRVIRP